MESRTSLHLWWSSFSSWFAKQFFEISSYGDPVKDGSDLYRFSISISTSMQGNGVDAKLNRTSDFRFPGRKADYGFVSRASMAMEMCSLEEANNFHI